LRFLKERKAPATGEVQDILSGEGLHRRSLESEVVLWGAGEPGSLRWIVAGIIAKSSRKDPMQDVVSSGSSSRDSSRQRQKITSSPRGGEAAREALGGEGVQGRVQQLSLIILGHTDSDLIPCWSSDEDKEREVTPSIRSDWGHGSGTQRTEVAGAQWRRAVVDGIVFFVSRLAWESKGLLVRGEGIAIEQQGEERALVIEVPSAIVVSFFSMAAAISLPSALAS
jgi:hypothetical protein